MCTRHERRFTGPSVPRLLAAVLAFGGVSAIARHGRAFCRTFTKPPISAAAQPSACPTEPDDAKMLYWRSSCVGYGVQKSASSQVTLEQAQGVAAQAFAAPTVTRRSKEA